ncbi:BTAD domain-containing putative transcriptional regulator [Kitasatospora sp. McL0602]|uniref:AfsR/SARP family transcriptional regulator n=1 Tax=Kitasatospora sp. McL0602 TaxID=3439530 RepID=UPI003F8A5A6D
MDGRPLAAALAPRHRGVLGYLLLNAGRVVSADRLIGAIWGGTPPETARTQIQVAVSAIRRTLRAAGAAELLATRSAGYVLTPEPGSLDLDDFAARAATRDDPAELRAALGLWRGPLLADVTAAYLDAARQRWEERRLVAFECVVDLELAVGRHAELVDELRAWTTEHPVRERLHGRLMLALYRDGRQPEALAVGREYRQLLAEQQGLDPGREFEEVERSILRADPGIRYAFAAPGAGTVPAQLPAAPADFTGRADQVDLLDGLLPDYGGRGAPAVVISTIAGVGGVGKTALAVHWAHRVRDRFPDGQLYIDLHGYSGVPRVRPIDALSRFLIALGVPADQIPADVDAAGDRYRSLLADRRILVVLDNAGSAEQVRPLLPGGTSSLAVITSRDRMAGLVALDGARRLTLEALTPAESLALLGRIVGESRTAAEPQAAAELAKLCGHLPLALRITAALLAELRDRSIADHAAALRKGGRLAELAIEHDGAASVRAAFDQSFAALAPDAARLFPLLGLVPGADFTVDAAAALGALTPQQCERLLDRLAAAHLVEERGGGRYGLHDLLRDYTIDRSQSDFSAAERDGALQRLLDWYLRTADAAARQRLFPSTLRLPIPHPAPDAAPESPPTGFDDDTLAGAWLDAERANLVAAIRHTSEHGPHAAAWLLSDTLRDYFRLGRHVTDWLVAAESGVAAATRYAGLLERAACEHNLAMAFDHGHDNESAVLRYGAALDLARRADWPRGVAAVNNSLAANAMTSGRLDESAAHLTEALAGYRRVGARDGEALGLGTLAGVLRKTGPLERALHYETKSLALFEEQGHHGRTTLAHHGIAKTCRLLGSFDQALEHLAVAMDLAKRRGDLEEQQDVLLTMAAVHLELGRYDEAEEKAAAGLALATACQDEVSTPEALNILGAVALALGHPQKANDHHERALQLARTIDYPCNVVDSLRGLAAARSALGRHTAALDLAQEAVTVAAAAQERVREGAARTTLASACLAAGDRELAISHADESLTQHRTNGHRPGEARALAVRAAASTGPDTEHHRARAGELFSALGMPQPGEC